MKFCLNILLIIILASSTSCFEMKGDPFCDWKYIEDYSRIPLIVPSELIRLNGDEVWSYTLSRYKINSPNVSTFFNVKQIGIKNEAFILITEDCVFQEHRYFKSAVKVSKEAGRNIASVFYDKKPIDSLYRSSLNDYKWYQVDTIWEEFLSKNKVPWCK
jgi:hypothetical protein